MIDVALERRGEIFRVGSVEHQPFTEASERDNTLPWHSRELGILVEPHLPARRVQLLSLVAAAGRHVCEMPIGNQGENANPQDATIGLHTGKTKRRCKTKFNGTQRQG